MQTDIHLVFPGTCREAFAFYEKTFDSKVVMTMKYGDAPPDTPVAKGSEDKVMHTSMPLGSMNLMGCDSPQLSAGPVSRGFHISLSTQDADEVQRLFAALSEGGSVMMPPQPTFWTPLFSMCTDRFGIGWMLSVPGPQPQG